MEFDPANLSHLKMFTVHGIQADEIKEMATAIEKIVNMIRVRSNIHPEEARRIMARAMGDTDSAEWSRLLRLPGESGTEDI